MRYPSAFALVSGLCLAPLTTPARVDAKERADAVSIRALWLCEGEYGNRDLLLKALDEALPYGDPDVLYYAYLHEVPGKERDERLAAALAKAQPEAELAFAANNGGPLTDAAECERRLKRALAAHEPAAEFMVGAKWLDEARNDEALLRKAASHFEAALAGVPEESTARLPARFGLGVCRFRLAKTPADYAEASRLLLRASGGGLRTARPAGLVALSRSGDEEAAKKWEAVLLKEVGPLTFRPVKKPQAALITDAIPLDRPQRYLDRFLAGLPAGEQARFRKLYGYRPDYSNLETAVNLAAGGDPEALAQLAQRAQSSRRYTKTGWETRECFEPVRTALLTLAASRVPQAVDALAEFESSTERSDEGELARALKNTAAGGRNGMRRISSLLCERLQPSVPEHAAFDLPMTYASLNPHFVVFEKIPADEPPVAKLEALASGGDRDAAFVLTLLKLKSNRQDVRDEGRAAMLRFADAGDEPAAACAAMLETDPADKAARLLALANKGDAGAAFVLAQQKLYAAVPDPAEGVRLMRIAAAANLGKAVLMMPRLVSEHPSLFPNEEADRWEMKRQADQKAGQTKWERESDEYKRNERLVLLKTLSDRGDGYASLLLTLEPYRGTASYEEQMGVRYRLLKKAADAGVPEAWLIKAHMHEEKGQFFSETEAARCRQKAADLGNAEAAVDLAAPREDSPEFRAELKKAAEGREGLAALLTLLDLLLKDGAPEADLAEASRLIDPAGRRTAGYEPYRYRLAVARGRHAEALGYLAAIEIGRSREVYYTSDPDAAVRATPSFRDTSRNEPFRETTRYRVLKKLADGGFEPATRKIAELENASPEK